MASDFAEIRSLVWNQFGASIDMLEAAIAACPDEAWGASTDFHEFWRIAFHTLFWLDLYSTGSEDGFVPPPPFGLEEMQWDGVPPRVYTRDELLGYAAYCRNKVRSIIDGLDAEGAMRTAGTRRVNMPYLELLMYTMRHNQHHVGQLNMLLRQRTDKSPGWVRKAKAD